MNTIVYDKVSDICQIVIFDKKIANYPSFKFVPEKVTKNIFGKTKTKQSHYLEIFYGTEEVTAQDILKKEYYMIINNIVYERSLVKIVFSSGKVSTIEKYFDTFEESNNYVNEFIEKYNLSEELVIIK